MAVDFRGQGLGPEPEANVPRGKLLAGIYTGFGIRPVRKAVERIMFGPTYLADPRSGADLVERFIEEQPSSA